jgi:hypothetical protein
LNAQSKKRDILNRREEMAKLADEVSSHSFNISGKQNDKAQLNNISSNSIDKLKGIIKEIVAENRLENVLFKQSISDSCDLKTIKFEIKFISNEEKNIHGFIDSMMRKSGFFAAFDSIKIAKKGEKSFMAKMQCRLILFKDDNYKKYVSITPSLNEISSTGNIDIFTSSRPLMKYTISCIINNSKAFINDSWMEIGDRTNDFEIKHIYPKSIDIMSCNKVSNIKIGETWYTSNQL